jgi:hypothetical protein
LNARDKDGFTQREILEGLVERTRNPERLAEYERELVCPPFPPALDYIWQAYWRLARRRGSNGFGPNPISWVEIDAFLRHTRIDLAPWEIEIIEALDDLERAEHARSQSDSSPGKS